MPTAMVGQNMMLGMGSTGAMGLNNMQGFGIGGSGLPSKYRTEFFVGVNIWSNLTYRCLT